MAEIRVIQIGAGQFGQSWLQLILDYPGTELAAVVDMIPENLERARKLSGLPDNRLIHHSDKAFQEVEADMVLIVTPPQTHKDLAIKALRAGFHVMMEKPLAHTYEEAIELLNISRRYDRKVMISQNYRWRPSVRTIKKLLKNGIIGNIGYIEYEFRKAMKFGGWRDQYSEILLEDMSIHHFDIMRFLLEKEPEEVFAQSFRPAWSWFSGNPSAGVMIRFQGDVYVNYFGSWVSRGKETTWNGDIRIVGDKGAIELIDDQIHLWKGYDSAEVEHMVVDPVEMPYDDRVSSLDDMVKAIRENGTPSTSIEDNIYSFALTCAAIQSAKTGKKIKLGMPI